MDTANTPNPTPPEHEIPQGDSPSGILKKQRNRNVFLIVGALIIFAVPVFYLMWEAEQKEIRQQAARAPQKKVKILEEDIDKTAWQAEALGRLQALEQENARIMSQLSEVTKFVENQSMMSRLPPFPGKTPRENATGSGPTNAQQLTPEEQAFIQSQSDIPMVVVPPSGSGQPPRVIPTEPIKPRKTPKQPAAGRSQQDSPDTPPPSAPPAIRKIHERAKETPSSIKTISAETGQDKKKPMAWLPSGSFLPGVILSGLDAPTQSGASGNPYPVLIRIDDLAVLPNRFRMDLKECFLVGGAYGDLSSERAFIRIEQLSCVKQNGATIDQALKAYVSGEDGKVGLRGKLVTRDGAALARALMAGFASGIGQAFRPTIGAGLTSTPGEVGFPDPASVGQAIGLSGLGQAARILAQHYTNMAKQIFPVIEINPGRKVDVVVTKGMELSTHDDEEEEAEVTARSAPLFVSTAR